MGSRFGAVSGGGGRAGVVCAGWAAGSEERGVIATHRRCVGVETVSSCSFVASIVCAREVQRLETRGCWEVSGKRGGVWWLYRRTTC